MAHCTDIITDSDMYIMGKRGNVEINNSPKAGIEPGASRFLNPAISE